MIPTIKMEKTGNTIKPIPSPSGSGPESHPMIGELTVSPVNPQVIVNPIAVAVPCGKMLASTASVVGNTGAIANPVQNTAIPAILESETCNTE